MYINVILLPLLNFIIIFFLGFYIGREGSCFVSATSIFISFLYSLYIFFEVVISQSVATVKIYNFISLDLYSIQIGFIFDCISSVMLLVITFISSIVHLYSITYLSMILIFQDLWLIYLYLLFLWYCWLLQIFFTNICRLRRSWVVFILLINFWFTRLLANKAALKAMIMNRIADVFFLLAIVFIFLKFKTTDFVIVFNLIPFFFNDIHFFLFKSFNSLK